MAGAYARKRSFPARRYGGNKRFRSSLAPYRRRYYGRRATLPHSQVVRNRLITPVTFVKLKYTPMASGSTPYRALSAIAGGYGEYSWHANSTYDPDLTGTGGQPTGHDQYYGFYGRGTVVASKIKVEFVNTSATAHFKVGISPTTEPNFTPSTETPNDWPGARSTTIGPYVGGAGSKTLVAFYRTSTIFGISSREIKDNSALYSEPVGSVVATPWYWLVWALPADATAVAASAIEIMVEITYYVRFFDRIELPIS